MSLRRKRRSVSDLRQRLHQYEKERYAEFGDEVYGIDEDVGYEDRSGNSWIGQFIPLSKRDLIIKAGISMAVLFLVFFMHQWEHPWLYSFFSQAKQVLNWDMLSSGSFPALNEELEKFGFEELSGSETIDKISLPVQGELKSSFGMREAPEGGEHEEMHYGLDLIAGEGAEVSAPWQGKVDMIMEEENYYQIILKHEEEWSTAYRGLNSVKIEEHDQLEAGEVMGTLGSAKIWDKPHLHFELRWNNRPVDPMSHISEWSELLEK